MTRTEVICAARSPPSFPKGAMATTGECLLGCGLVGLAAGAGLLQFVINGLLGMALALGALILLLIGGVLVRGVAVTRGRAVAGLMLLVIATGALGWAVGQACMTASDEVRYAQSPVGPPPETASLWLVVALGTAVAACLFALALWLRAGWPARRSLMWGVAAIAVCPVAVLIFLALAVVLPLDA